MHVGHMASHVCDTWQAIVMPCVIMHGPFGTSIYIRGFQFSSWQLKWSAWGSSKEKEEKGKGEREERKREMEERKGEREENKRKGKKKKRRKNGRKRGKRKMKKKKGCAVSRPG